MSTKEYVSSMRLLVILGSHKVLKKNEIIKIISIVIYKVQVSPYGYIPLPVHPWLSYTLMPN